jgi:3-oxoacyl-[acyl-carrier-protein] synthase III
LQQHVPVLWNVCCSCIQSGDIKECTNRADKMSYCRLYRQIYLYNFGDGAGAVLFEPNYEGLEDRYLRSDGVGRDFLKLMLEDTINFIRNSKKIDIILFKTVNCI